MFDRFTETLRLEVAGVQERFPLGICRKSLRFADLEIQQYWIDRGAVYGRRDQPTHRSIVEFFWAVCRQQGAATGRSAQEQYILARLLPETRIYGARRVVAAGVLSRPASARISVRESIRDLEAELITFADRRMSRVQFRDATANLIGPIHFDVEARQRYLEFTNELFGRQSITTSRFVADGRDHREMATLDVGIGATSRPRS